MKPLGKNGFPFPKCPKCGHVDYEVEHKWLIWVPNGRTAMIGYSRVKCVDPVPAKGRCKNCKRIVDFEELEGEKVEFT